MPQLGLDALNSTPVAEQRRQLHKRFGIFRYSDELAKQGIKSPAEQIAVIGWFLKQRFGLADDLPPLDDDQAADSWMRIALRDAISEWHSGPSAAELTRATPLSPKLLDDWDLDHDLAELLNYHCGPRAYTRTITRLQVQGFAIRLNELPDLEGRFVLFRLPRAVRSFIPSRGRDHEEAWLASVFYRYALHEILSDRRSREHLAALETAPSPEASPEVMLAQEEEAAILSALPQAMEKLPSQEQSALSLYFGFSGPEKTLAEIGQQLGVSEYLARIAVVRGLAMLSVFLCVPGPLSRAEFELLRLMFVDGMDVAHAAQKLHLATPEARRILAGTGEKFRRGLRPRTVAQQIDTNQSEEEKAMPSTNPTHESQVGKTQISNWLAELKETPPLRRNNRGELEVDISGNWLEVANVREIALLPDIAPILEAARTPVAWLFAPEPPQTLEISAEARRQRLLWEQALQPIHQRSWQMAEMLYLRCLESLPRGKESFAHEELDPIQMVHRSLTAVSHAIESRLPESLQRQEWPRFLVGQQNNGDPVGTWEGDASDEAINLRVVLGSRARRLGELSGEAVDVLTQTFIKEFFASELTLPGFRRELESTSERVVLTLLPRTTKVVRAAKLLEAAGF